MSVGPNNADSKTASRENNFSAAAKNTLVKVAEIPQFEFCARRWYHVCIRYETRFRKGGGVRLSVERKGSSSISRECGCLTLWVEGRTSARQSFQRDSQYNPIPSVFGLYRDTATAGASAGAAEKINRGQGSAWWLGPTVMLEGSISDAFVAEIFKRGHTYRGCFHPREAVVDEPGTAGDPRGSPSDATVCPRNCVMFAFSAMYRMNIDAVDALRPGGAASPNAEPREIAIGLERLALDETDSKRVASLLASARTDVGNLLYNAVSSGAPPAPGPSQSPCPQGNRRRRHVHSLARCRRRTAFCLGCQFPFSPNCALPDTKSLNEALLLLSLVLHRNRANMSEPRRSTGTACSRACSKKRPKNYPGLRLILFFRLSKGAILSPARGGMSAGGTLRRSWT